MKKDESMRRKQQSILGWYLICRGKSMCFYFLPVTAKISGITWLRFLNVRAKDCIQAPRGLW